MTNYAARTPRPLANAELLESWEAAFYLAVKQRTLDEYIQASLIRAVGTGRRRRILAQSIRDYIERGGMPSRTRPSNHPASVSPRLAGRFAASPQTRGPCKRSSGQAVESPAATPGRSEER